MRPALERKVAALAAHRSQYAMEPDLFPSSILERLLGIEYFTVAGDRRALIDRGSSPPTADEPDGPRRPPSRAFAARFPHFDPAGTFSELRRSEYGRLDDERSHLPRLHRRRAARGEPGRRPRRAAPHPSCSATRTRTTRRRWPSTELVERARRAVCEFFNAPPGRVPVRLHRQRQRRAPAGRRVVPVRSPAAPSRLTFDNHNSVNGIREFARRKGAAIAYVPVVAPELRLDRAAMYRTLAGRRPIGPQPARLPCPVELLRRPAPARPGRRGPRRGMGRARRRGRLRADQPARPRPASGPTS